MFLYAIKSIILLSIMYIPFLLMLRNESFFRFNRVVLLVIVILSLVLPLCDVHFLSLNLFTAEAQENVMADVGIPVYVVDEASVADASEGMAEETSFLSSVNWWAVAAWIYLIGMVVTILVKLVQLAMLYRTIHRGVLWTERKDGVRIYCHAGDITPFSWFNTIVISENDYEENAQVIIRHEMGHIVNYHSLDIILVNICEVIQWCNPLSWILVGSLRDVHEYEADDAVLASGVDAHRYQLLLIKKAVGSSSYAFANSFNHSLLKKRITMMVSKKSNPWMRTKALYIIPMALVALSAFATPEFIAPIEEAVAESTPAVDISENEAVVQSNIVSEKTVEEPSVKDVDEKVGLKDCLILIGYTPASYEDLKKYIVGPATVATVYGVDNVREELRGLGIRKIERMADDNAVKNLQSHYVEKGYPEARIGIVSVSDGNSDKNVYIHGLSSSSSTTPDCYSYVMTVESGGESITKVVSSDGEDPVIFVDNVKCNDISKIDKNSIDHINVIKTPEAIKKIYGDNVEYKNGVVEIFTKDGTNKQEQKPVPVSSSNKVFAKAEVAPKFPGGDTELMNYIHKEMVYPEACIKEKKQGRTIISFVVEKDGSLSDYKILRHVHDDMDKEAIRIVKSMPKWTPAIKDGKYVRCKYTMPVTFKLDMAKK